MDLTNLEFPDDSFDVVLDKGTLDALFCGGEGMPIAQSLIGIHRVLRPGGHFISITYGEPRSRIPVFEAMELGWRLFDPLMIENRTKSARHWIYRFRKLLEGELLERADGDAGEDDCEALLCFEAMKRKAQ